MTQVLSLTPDQVKQVQQAHHHAPGRQLRGNVSYCSPRILIVGAGGLGSPAAVYLALAGVGTIGIVDFDVVDVSNLQRQVLHHHDDVGRPKVVSAVETIKEYNPDTNVNVHETWLTSENAMEIIPQYDVVVNGADNFPSRYLINDACYLSNKPLVDGSILIFDGQTTVFIPGQGCYRCLFPLTASSRDGAQLCRGRSLGCPYRSGGQHSGRGDVEIIAGNRRKPSLSVVAHRCPEHGISPGTDTA